MTPPDLQDSPPTRAAPFPPLALLLVEDDRDLRETLASALPKTGQVEVLGAYASAEEAVAEAPWARAEILLLDLELPGVGGIELTAWVRKHHPAVRVAIHTIHDDRELVFRAIEAGAHGYVLKGEGPQGIVAQLLNLRAGEAPVSPAIATMLLEHLGPAGQPIESDPLSRRETELLRLLADGYRYKEVAEALRISEHTVKSHVSRIYGKLEAGSRSEALRRARLLGLV